MSAKSSTTAQFDIADITWLIRKARTAHMPPWEEDIFYRIIRTLPEVIIYDEEKVFTFYLNDNTYVPNSSLGSKIHCIKIVRRHLDIGLKEAKEWVESQPISFTNSELAEELQTVPGVTITTVTRS